jgi:hypothetical protein
MFPFLFRKSGIEKILEVIKISDIFRMEGPHIRRSGWAVGPEGCDGSDNPYIVGQRIEYDEPVTSQITDFKADSVRSPAWELDGYQ